ncbi:MAG TPA: hypothetical protein VFA08_01325 [Actinomycetota bacterium]|jgi:hypothetical protein|nr:hypothetical protein [Actinomycetota bacterium]
MGNTVKGATVRSRTIENDEEVQVSSLDRGEVPTVAFASFGTSPALTSMRGGSGRFRMRVTSGTGTPAIAANNIQITCGFAPRKVFLDAGTQAPGFYVASISGNVINIGTKVAPAASTAFDFELVVLP